MKLDYLYGVRISSSVDGVEGCVTVRFVETMGLDGDVVQEAIYYANSLVEDGASLVLVTLEQRCLHEQAQAKMTLFIHGFEIRPE